VVSRTKELRKKGGTSPKQYNEVSAVSLGNCKVRAVTLVKHVTKKKEREISGIDTTVKKKKKKKR